MIAIGGMPDAEYTSRTAESDQSNLLTKGLECYLVGGSVRDQKLGLENFDRDWVVIGASEEEMLRRGFKKVGMSFPVFLHPRTKEEYALARTERKTGRGYKGFEVDVSRTVTLEQDLKRRDLTINAMAMTPDGSRLIDPFCGERDLEQKVLRHVSEHFAEDPLRVLRVARFAARFHSKGFTLAEETRQMMSAIAVGGELDDLVPERVWREVQTALEGDDPWKFFQTLQICDALEKLFPEFLVLFQVRDAVNGARSSEFTQRAETALSSVATNSNNAVRFSVLMFLVGEHELSAVEKYCDRWKVPRKYSRLAIQASKFGKQALAMSRMSPETMVDFVRALDGIRNPKRLDDCVAVWEAVSLPDSSNVSLLPTYRNAMASVDAKMLVSYLKGKALMNRIREIQIENVAGLMKE